MPEARNKAALEGARGAAYVTGYGACGLLIESIVQHHYPWVQGGAVTMAVTSLFHGIQSAWRGWLEVRRAAIDITSHVSKGE